ncbi:DUF1538 domain-containing protein [Staphylospora marina]|uniref:DUF1538 domain-containing protein n=1 Tax=Staphylospora marina TaxID=2490858 RepID=UPI000F5BC986|nr:DUF1538 domain-containing protein [Staphylospora marina]
MTHPFHGFGDTMLEVALALAPLFVVFLLFQFIRLKLPWKKVMNILKGFVLTFFGLAFFLHGVHIGFLPTGEQMGMILGDLSHNWILIPVGLVLGFVATFAEPAVRILNQQVDKVSSGSIPEKVMLYTVSIGVAVSVALSMLRVIAGIPLWYFIIPGYLLAFVLTRYTKDSFTAIAFDSGGVATGPMTVTFILSMVVGVATVLEDRNPLLEGFGMISLVALAPILSVLTLGILYGRKEKENERSIES